MSSKKSSPAATTKTLDQISAEIITLQNSTRATIAQLGDALVAKKEELNGLDEAIKGKKDELAELHDKEKLLVELEALREQFQDAQHEHDRSLKALEIHHTDKMAELQRAHAAADAARIQKIQDEDRAKKIAQEDENRLRALQFEQQQKSLAEQKAILDRQAAEQGSFEDRVKTDVAGQVGAIKRDFDSKVRILESEKGAEIKILTAEVERLKKDCVSLATQLTIAQDAAQKAADRANAIAVASLDKDAGKQALEKLETIATEQAKSRGR